MIQEARSAMWAVERAVTSGFVGVKTGIQALNEIVYHSSMVLECPGHAADQCQGEGCKCIREVRETIAKWGQHAHLPSPEHALAIIKSTVEGGS